MEEINLQSLKPAEGLCVRLPNGRPALQFISYRDVDVRTYEKNNRVRVIVDFKEPFIRDKVEEQSVSAMS